MDKNYKEIKFECGISLEEAVTELLRRKDNGELVCGNFNYTMLYSDTVTMDNAYLAVHGKTKKEFDAFVSKNRQKMYGSTIPSENEKDLANKNLVKEWVEKGHAILDEKYYDKWEEVVPIRLDDLYHGMELGACLEIVDALNKGCTLDEAKDIIYAQNHSGMSYGLVLAMVKAFCDRGAKFSEYAKLYNNEVINMNNVITQAKISNGGMFGEDNDHCKPIYVDLRRLKRMPFSTNATLLQNKILYGNCENVYVLECKSNPQEIAVDLKTGLPMVFQEKSIAETFLYDSSLPGIYSSIYRIEYRENVCFDEGLIKYYYFK